MAFAPLRSLLPSAARRAGITRDIQITHALRAAQGELARIFGAQYAAFADAVAVQKDGVLAIACRSPAVAQTIRLQMDRVLTAIRAGSENLQITRILLIPRSRSDVTAWTATMQPGTPGYIEDAGDPRSLPTE